MSRLDTHNSGPPFVSFPNPSDFDVDAWFATPELRSTSSKNLLEVVVAWDGIILDIRHYKTPQRIAFGSHKHADFNYPIDAATDDPHQVHYFPLIEPCKSGFLLCFYPEMEGTVEENGEHFTLLDLVQAGRAHCFDRSGRCYYPLLPGAQFKLHCKGLDIQIGHVAAPQFSLQWSRHLGMNAPVLSFSILTHLLMAILAIASTSSPQPAVQTKQTESLSVRLKKKKNSIYLKPVHLCIPIPHSTQVKLRKKPITPRSQMELAVQYKYKQQHKAKVHSLRCTHKTHPTYHPKN